MKANTRKILATLIILPVIAALIGCGEKETDSNKESSGAAPSSNSTDYPKFARAWLGDNNLEQGDSMSISDNPKVWKLAEKSFRDMDWGNAAIEPSVTIELDAARSLKVRPHSDSEQQGFVAIWKHPGPTIGNTTSAIAKKSERLPDAERALELLKSFLQKDGDIESLVDWVK